MADESIKDLLEKLTEENEILRMHITDDSNPQVLVNVFSMWRNVFKDGVDTDPGVWGVLMATALYHIAKAHRMSLVTLHQQLEIEEEVPSEELILMRIQETLVKEMGDPEFASAIEGWTYKDNEDKH